MALSFEADPCAKCEEVLQPYLDRELSDAERAEAEKHLDECSYCRKPVVLGDRLPVDLAVVELGRALDDVARDREADDLLRLVGVNEGRRDRVLRLAQESVLDDHVVVVDLDDLADLSVVAGDDFITFHERCVPRPPAP